jgi:hypothetical protein
MTTINNNNIDRIFCYFPVSCRNSGKLTKMEKFNTGSSNAAGAAMLPYHFYCFQIGDLCSAENTGEIGIL